MRTVLQRENERGGLTVRGYRSDNGAWCSLVVMYELGGRWALYRHGAGQLGVRLERTDAVRVAQAILDGTR